MMHVGWEYGHIRLDQLLTQFLQQVQGNVPGARLVSVPIAVPAPVVEPVKIKRRLIAPRTRRGRLSATAIKLENQTLFFKKLPDAAEAMVSLH